MFKNILQLKVKRKNQGGGGTEATPDENVKFLFFFPTFCTVDSRWRQRTATCSQRPVCEWSTLAGNPAA